MRQANPRLIVCFAQRCLRPSGRHRGLPRGRVRPRRHGQPCPSAGLRAVQARQLPDGRQQCRMGAVTRRRSPLRDRGGRCGRLPSRDDGHLADRQELQHRPTHQPGHEQRMDHARLPAGNQRGNRRRRTVPARRTSDRGRSCRWTWYWRKIAPTSGMLDVDHAAQAEIWMRTAGVAPVTAWPSLAEWKQHVDMLVDLGNKGHVADGHDQAVDVGDAGPTGPVAPLFGGELRARNRREQLVQLLDLDEHRRGGGSEPVGQPRHRRADGPLQPAGERLHPPVHGRLRRRQPPVPAS